MKKITEDQKQTIIKALDKPFSVILDALSQIEINAVENEFSEWDLSEIQRTRIVRVIDIFKKANLDIKNSPLKDIFKKANLDIKNSPLDSLVETINDAGNIIKFSPQFENLKNALRNINNQTNFHSLQERFKPIAIEFNKFVIPAFSESLQKKIERYQLLKDNEPKLKKEYKSVLKSVKAWLEGKGFIIPINFDEFFEWYCDYQFAGNSLPTIKRKDFKDFAVFIEKDEMEVMEESEQKKVKSDEISIKKLSDILEDKYKNKEDDIFAVLGKSFPEFYNVNGKALNNKKGIKAILNSWYKLLFEFNIISLNPTKPQKEQICRVLLERCKFSDKCLSSKTLFENEGIEVKFRLEYTNMQKLIKSLKIN